jgi:hypothetical protein
MYEAVVLGETFDVNVTISGVSETQNLIGVEFKLRYNTTLLSVVKITEGPFLQAQSWAFNNTVFATKIKDDYVLIGLLLLPHAIIGQWHAFPEGSGTLATITFNVTHNGDSSLLQLTDTLLVNTQEELISHGTHHGYYEFVSWRYTYHSIIWDTMPYHIVAKSNSIISPTSLDFDQVHKIISFNVTGLEGTTGFCNLTIPKELIDAPDSNQWLVLLDGLSVDYVISHNATHTSLYFTYEFHSTRNVLIMGTTVIPEFPTVAIPLLFLTVTLIAFAIKQVACPSKQHFV